MNLDSFVCCKFSSVHLSNNDNVMASQFFVVMSNSCFLPFEFYLGVQHSWLNNIPKYVLTMFLTILGFERPEYNKLPEKGCNKTQNQIKINAVIHIPSFSNTRTDLRLSLSKVSSPSFIGGHTIQPYNVKGICVFIVFTYAYSLGSPENEPGYQKRRKEMNQLRNKI